MSLLTIGRSGLLAAQAGLTTTQRNIANVNTPGYHRQEAQFASVPGPRGSHGGGGVEVVTLSQIRSPFLERELQSAQVQSSFASSYAAQTDQVSKKMESTAQFVSTSLDEFFAGALSLSAAPESEAERAAVLAKGEQLAGTVREQYRSLSQTRESNLRAIQDGATRANQITTQLAELNAHPVDGSNELRDFREQLVSELTSLVGGAPTYPASGGVEVRLPSGQPLVSGRVGYAFNVTADGTVTLGDPMGEKRSSALPGGEVGGLIAARTTSIQPALAELNRVAVGISSAINAVTQSHGYFNDPMTWTAAPPLFNSPVVPDSAAINAEIKLTEDPLVNANYSAVYDAGQDAFTVTRKADGMASVVPSGSPVRIGGVAQGFSIQAPEGAVHGDAWTLNLGDFAADLQMTLRDPATLGTASPNAAGPANGDGALALAGLRQAGGALAVDAMVHDLAGAAGRTAAGAAFASEQASHRQADAYAAQQAVAGVNLDEEATNLMKYRQAYEASARALAVADSLFDSLLAIGQ